MQVQKKNVIIIGAAGRDFHNFNTYFRGMNYSSRCIHCSTNP